MAEEWQYNDDEYSTFMNARTGTGFYGDVIVSGYGYDKKEGREIEKEVVSLATFLRQGLRTWLRTKPVLRLPKGFDNLDSWEEDDYYYTEANARTGTGFYGDVIVSGYGYDKKEGREVRKEIISITAYLRKEIEKWMKDRNNKAENLKWSGRKGNRTLMKKSREAESFKSDYANAMLKKARRHEHEMLGMLPKARGYGEFKRKIEYPQWFRNTQLLLVGGLSFMLAYHGMRKEE